MTEPTPNPHEVEVAVDVDVVIVGAGAGGLLAACELAAGGMSVRVLESRSRSGGRLLSTTHDDMGVDLGATWFWPSEPMINQLVQKLDIATHSQHIAGDAMYHDRPESQRLDGNPLDVPSGRFSKGADHLTTALADLLPTGTVSFDSPVDEISIGETSATVRFGGTEIRCSHAVVAVPPALAVDAIAFTPPLPDSVASLCAATPVWMGTTTKVAAIYPRAFWRDNGLSGSAISHLGPMREIHDMSGPHGSPAVLFGFAPHTAELTETAVTDQLAEIFGPDAGAPTKVIVQNWQQERWTTPAGAEHLTDYQTYGHRLFQSPVLHGRLHWASTETSPHSPGHIEGALAAGRRAATTIRTTLDPSNEQRDTHA